MKPKNQSTEVLPRTGFERRHCLIPADGFYEWQKQERGKQPYFIRRLDHQPFAFAGLWETWQEITTCTIITTDANELLEFLHERMPVILKSEDYKDWLGPDYQETVELQSLLKPFSAEQTEVYPVSNQVNSPAMIVQTVSHLGPLLEVKPHRNIRYSRSYMRKWLLIFRYNEDVGLVWAMKFNTQNLDTSVNAEVTTASLFWGSGLAIVSFLLMIVVLG